jgi:hypothetical protein
VEPWRTYDFLEALSKGTFASLIPFGYVVTSLVDLIPSVTCTNAGDAVITPVQNLGHGDREMEELRGTCQHPPTELSSVPSTDIYQIPCESGRPGHSLELEKRGAKQKR